MIRHVGVVVSTRHPTAHPTPIPSRAPTPAPTPLPPTRAPTPTAGLARGAAIGLRVEQPHVPIPHPHLDLSKATAAAKVVQRSSIDGTKWLILHVLIPLSSLLLITIAAMTLRAQRKNVTDVDVDVDDGVDLLQLNEHVYHTYQNMNENVAGFTATISDADGMSLPEGETYREFVLERADGSMGETDVE